MQLERHGGATGGMCCLYRTTNDQRGIEQVQLYNHYNNGTASQAKYQIIPVVTIPKSSYILKEGGLHGEDYHIEPSDQTISGTTREIGAYEQMTPTNYTRTGESIDYVPNPPETSEWFGMQRQGTASGTPINSNTALKDTLSWRIWGEDDANIYLISENPTKTKWGITNCTGRGWTRNP